MSCCLAGPFSWPRALLVPVFAAALAACEKKPPPPAPPLGFTEVAFAALPGWFEDDVGAALPALARSCARLAIGSAGGGSSNRQSVQADRARARRRGTSKSPLRQTADCPPPSPHDGPLAQEANRGSVPIDRPAVHNVASVSSCDWLTVYESLIFRFRNPLNDDTP